MKRVAHAADPVARAPAPVAALLSASMDESATALGRTWAAACRREFEREGRPVCGGWPGTLSEARARVWQMLAGGTRAQRAPLVVSEAEREQAARTAYRSARDEWRRHTQPEEP